MPFITVQTNLSLSPEQEQNLKAGLGKAIEYVPYKSEKSLMIAFQDNAKLWLQGDNQRPMAYIRIAVFGNRQHYGYAELSQAVTLLFKQILSISPENVYIQYEDIPAWTVAGQTFGEQ